jgi:hypothetical protein
MLVDQWPPVTSSTTSWPESASLHPSQPIPAVPRHPRSLPLAVESIMTSGGSTYVLRPSAHLLEPQKFRTEHDLVQEGRCFRVLLGQMVAFGLDSNLAVGATGRRSTCHEMERSSLQ